MMLDDLIPGTMFFCDRNSWDKWAAWIVLSVDKEKNTVTTLSFYEVSGLHIYVDYFSIWPGQAARHNTHDLWRFLDHEGNDTTHEIKERSKRDDDG
jgi:hypothetical protein